MGIFGKIWKGIKKGAKAVGKIAQKAAPALAFIPGVGTVAAAAIGGAGGLLSGGWKGALKGAAGGALGGLGKGLLGKIPGVSGIGGKITDFAKNALFSGGSNPTGFDMGDLGQIGKIASTGLGLYSGYQGYKQSQADQARARALTDQAVDLTGAEAARANALWGDLSPLRSQYIQGVQNFYDPTNPFAIGRPQQGSGALAQIASQIHPSQLPGGPGKAKERMPEQSKTGFFGDMFKKLKAQQQPGMDSFASRVANIFGGGSPFQPPPIITDPGVTVPPQPPVVRTSPGMMAAMASPVTSRPDQPFML